MRELSKDNLLRSWKEISAHLDGVRWWNGSAWTAEPSRNAR